MQIKAWYHSPTIWTNLVSVGAVILTSFCGVTVPPELAAGILAIINGILVSKDLAPTAKKARERNWARERELGSIHHRNS